MKNWGFILIGMMLFFGSCEKDEIPVQPHAPGDVTNKEVEIGNYYSDQVWYSIENGEEVARNHKTDWDLAFECNEPGWRITMNSANIAYSSATGETDLLAITDTIGMTWKWDEFSGNLDSTAIGDWRTTPEIFVLNRGKNELGKPLGLTKLIFDSVTDEAFYFRHTEFNTNQWISDSVIKNADYTFSYFSLKGTGSQVDIAPPKTEWDIVFTQYTFVFYDMTPIVPYLVTGAILNPNNTYSAKRFDKEFSDITSDDILSSVYNQRIDNIGYDWKYYDFDNGYYITLPEKNYIFRAQSGKMFKIHFLDWYNNQGEKGSPSFEYSEL